MKSRDEGKVDPPTPGSTKYYLLVCIYVHGSLVCPRPVQSQLVVKPGDAATPCMYIDTHECVYIH